MKESFYLGLNLLGFHSLAYREWGTPLDNPTLICVHGLTRNGHDFDWLAETLSSHYHVVTPDVVGRGQSDWLTSPVAYNYPQYLNDMTNLIARLNVSSIDWLGTSMGGLIGLMLAALPNSPIKRLILNDIGPYIKGQALLRIGTYSVQQPTFSSLEGAELYLKAIHAPFGTNLSPYYWEKLTEQSVVEATDGTFILAFDPNAMAGFLNPETLVDVDLWSYWDMIQCPILVLRGQDSDILDLNTVQEMKNRQPSMSFIEFKQCGHAPSLAETHQIQAISDWLNSTLINKEA